MARDAQCDSTLRSWRVNVQDESPKVLQTLLGHKTATLTLDRYGHLFPDDLGSIADAFDAAVRTAADDLRTNLALRAVPSDG